MNPMIRIATELQSLGTAGTMLMIVLKMTLILLIARLLVLVLPRASAAAKHLGITVALCGVLALPVIAFVVPAWPLALLPAEESAQSAETARKEIGSTGDDQEYGALSAAVTVVKATGVVRGEKIDAISRTLETVKHSWKGLLLIAIGAISGLFLLRMVIGIIGVGNVARNSEIVEDDVALSELDRARDHLQLSRDVRLLRSARISVPVVWGVLKPILLLPASSVDWSRERLRVVLLHELAHVKRLDGITLLITRAAVAIFWFHPLMWALERAGRRECERACDDLVLATGTRPSDYAEHLLNIAKALPQFDPFRSVTLAMSRRSQLEGRLLSILQPHVRRGNFSMRAVAVVITFALFAIVPIASLEVVAEPPQGQAAPVPEGKVDFGPNVAAKIQSAPDYLINKIERFTLGDNYVPKTGEEWYDRGMDLHRADRYDDARAAFQRAIDDGYRVAGSKYNIACGYALSGDEQNALLWLRASAAAGFDLHRALEDSDFDPMRRSAAFQQLVGVHTHGDEPNDRLTEARQRYAELRGAASPDGKEWFDVGLDLLRLRMLDEAIDSYRHAIDLGQKTSTAMYNLACAYSLKGDTAAAEEWLNRAVENGFDNIDKLKNDPDLANVRRNNARFAYLVDLADDLRLHTGKMKWFSEMLGDESHWEEAMPRYVAATVKHPNIGRTWFNLGYAQLQVGDNAGSAESFKRAIALGYRTPTSTYNLACAYARAGQNAAAIDALEKARKAGFDLSGYVNDDADLESLRGDARFEALRKEVRSEAREKRHEKKMKKHVEKDVRKHVTEVF